MSRHTISPVVQVWDDDHGERIEIGPDGDGLACHEIRFITDKGEITNRIFMTDECLEKFSEALAMYRSVAVRGDK